MACKHWSIGRQAILLASFLLLGGFAMAAPGDRTEIPVVTAGSVQNGYSLVGQWQFQEGDELRWASPGYDDSGWRGQLVPGPWPDKDYPEAGQFAWYRLTLQFDLDSPNHLADLGHLGVAMGKVMSAYELYAGGRLLGGVGKLPPLNEINYDYKAVFEIPEDAVDANGKLVLALRVWSGSANAIRNFGGGAYEGEFTLGNYAELIRSNVLGQLPGLLMSMLFIAFGIYHLYLNRRNPQLQSYLWFGLMAINVGIYALMLNQGKYLLGWSFLAYEKIEYGSIYLFPAVAMQLIWSTLELPISRRLRVYQTGFVAAAFAVVLIPGLEFHFSSLTYWQLYTIPLVIYAPWLIIREALAGNYEARTALVGVIIFVATCINDLALDLADADTSRLLPYGFLAVMISMAVSLANRFTGMLNNLENEVATRTADLETANLQLAEAARHDPLTGLFNRRGFIEAADAEVNRVFRSGREFTLVMADIDNFKQFNDRYGHAFGDHVLERVADMLSHRVRDVDRVGRWGGEEFIFLLPETDSEGAEMLAEKLRESVALNVFEFSGERVSVTLTFGVATHHTGEDLESCIARADTALYQGKKRGRNRVMVGGSYKGLTLVP